MALEVTVAPSVVTLIESWTACGGQLKTISAAVAVARRVKEVFSDIDRNRNNLLEKKEFDDALRTLKLIWTATICRYFTITTTLTAMVALITLSL